MTNFKIEAKKISILCTFKLAVRGAALGCLAWLLGFEPWPTQGSQVQEKGCAVFIQLSSRNYQRRCRVQPAHYISKDK